VIPSLARVWVAAEARCCPAPLLHCAALCIVNRQSPDWCSPSTPYSVTDLYVPVLSFLPICFWAKISLGTNECSSSEIQHDRSTIGNQTEPSFKYFINITDHCNAERLDASFTSTRRHVRLDVIYGRFCCHNRCHEQRRHR
jgi:hypothetical protein